MYSSPSLEIIGGAASCSERPSSAAGATGLTATPGKPGRGLPGWLAAVRLDTDYFDVVFLPAGGSKCPRAHGPRSWLLADDCLVIPLLGGAVCAYGRAALEPFQEVRPTAGRALERDV